MTFLLGYPKWTLFKQRQLLNEPSSSLTPKWYGDFSVPWHETRIFFLFRLVWVKIIVSYGSSNISLYVPIQAMFFSSLNAPNFDCTFWVSKRNEMRNFRKHETNAGHLIAPQIILNEELFTTTHYVSKALFIKFDKKITVLKIKERSMIF